MAVDLLPVPEFKSAQQRKERQHTPNASSTVTATTTHRHSSPSVPTSKMIMMTTMMRRSCRRSRVAAVVARHETAGASSHFQTVRDDTSSSHHSMMMMMMMPLLLTVLAVFISYNRSEIPINMVMFTNAFVVGNLPQATKATTILPTKPRYTTTTKLFVSNDFTRSATTASSTSSSTSSVSIITEAGFRTKKERIGIRKRIRSVLENARRRSGFSSSSSLSMSNNATRNEASLIVAEAASIGGLYESVDFELVNNNNNNNMNINNNDDDKNNNNRSMNQTISNGVPVISSLPTTAASTSSTPSNGIHQAEKTTPPETKKNGMTLEQVQGRSSPDTGVALKSKVNGSSGNDSGDISQSKSTNKNQVEVDAILNSGKVGPLPFRLPKLTMEQKNKLVAGERIQEQSKMGRDGSGYVVLDVKAPDYVVWECLLDFEKYPEYIGTVRSMQMFTNTHLKQSYIAEKPVVPGTGRETRHYGTASITRASFVLSKFLLKIAAVHRYRPHPAGHYMEFTLDKGCRNVVLKDAKGIWYTESNPDGRQGYTRIWLLCELSISRVLPKFIVDYAAKRAMPRASNWIQPVIERVKKEFNIVD